MELFVAVAVALALGCLLIGWALRGSRNPTSRQKFVVKTNGDHPPSTKAAYKDRNYRGMSIRLCERPCNAAVKLRTRVFLEGEAPALPLQGCNRTCNCEYTLHHDRRRGGDRRFPAVEVDAASGRNALQDQRNGKDRRRRAKPYEGYT